MCGTWVADHMVICSPVGSTTVDRGSMNAGTSRCCRKRALDDDAVGSARAARWRRRRRRRCRPAPESKTQVAFSFVPRSGWTRSAPSATAASMSSTTGRSSYSTIDLLGGVAGLRPHCAPRRPRRSRRRIDAGRPRAAGWVGAFMSGVIGHAQGRPDRAGEVGAGPHRDTPGAPLAPLVSIEVIARVRDRAAHHRQVQHARQRDVVGPAGPAGDQPGVLLAAAAPCRSRAVAWPSSTAVIAAPPLAAPAAPCRPAGRAAARP